MKLPDRIAPLLEELPLPREEDLPPADEPLWTRESLRPWLEDGSRPLARLWAIDQLSHRGEEWPLDAVVALLESRDEDVLLEALALIVRAPEARAVAAAREVAVRLPGIAAAGDDVLRVGLACLKRLDPAAHVFTFAAHLEHREPSVRAAAVEGLVASGAPAVGERLFAVLGSESDHGVAFAALGGLLRRGDPAAVRKGARAFLENVARSDGLLRTEDLAFDVLDRLGFPKDLIEQVDAALGGEDEEGPRWVDQDARERLFRLPRDEEEARRAAAVFPAGLRERLAVLVENEDYDALAAFLGEQCPRALRAIAAIHPSFASLATALEAFLDEALDPEVTARLDLDDRRGLVHFGTVVLALAARGRVAREELEEARSEPPRLLRLLAADDLHLSGADLKELAALLPRESLLPLADGPGGPARVHALCLLAVQAPGEFLLRALSERGHGLDHGLVGAATAAGGDAVLPVLAGCFLEYPSIFTGGLFGLVIEDLRTRRAAAYLERYFHALGCGVEAQTASRVLERALRAGDLPLMERTLARLSRGDLDLSMAMDFNHELQRVARGTRTLLEVLGRSEPAGSLVDAAIEAYRDSDAYRDLREADEADEDEDGWFDEAEEEAGEDEGEPFGAGDPFGAATGRFGWRTHPEDEPPPTILRDAPKVGRNDPCPCGSGKKHKKCCGRG